MQERFDCLIRTKQDLCDAVQRFGIVPLFENVVPGFSVEEHVAPEAWFTDDEGVWEWKGPVIRETGCAYGKFFGHKAVFIAADWYPDFVNFRRDGYDFEGWYEDGLVTHDEKRIYDELAAGGCIPSKLLKRMLNFRKGGNSGNPTVGALRCIPRRRCGSGKAFWMRSRDERRSSPKLGSFHTSWNCCRMQTRSGSNGF